ncbi:hypothetical protein HDV01_002558 [Terramyces sp. JEL0728]|nr:hypothetical protein HDV01_002558 [Terramyces sp. JEL0728]
MDRSEPLKTVDALHDWPRNRLNVCHIPLNPKPNPRVIACHDMQGGYRSDANIQGNKTAMVQYTLQYWQFIDVFIYFSHHRITIPPAAWTNAAHRNSVVSLGTFIVEWGEGIPEILKLMYGPEYNKNLPSTQRDFHPFFADKLVDLAVYYNFDGWLINIESPLPSGIHSIVLARFLEYLTQTMHRRKKHSLIIWYDSVISDGSLRWQDQLNTKNEMFFNVCDALFVNYTWNENRLRQSAVNAMGRKRDLYTGIDVWGRNSFGGGGFNVHRALKEIYLNDTSVAIFAPAWTFERFGGEDFHQIEKRFWMDKYQDISAELSPDETTGIDKADFGCVAEYITAKPITSDTFYTDFDQGFGKCKFVEGRNVNADWWTHISHQSVLPNNLRMDFIAVVGGKFRKVEGINWSKVSYDHNMAYHGGSSLCISNASQDALLVQTAVRYQLYAFDTDISRKILKLMYKKSGIQFGVSLTVQTHSIKEHVLFPAQTDGEWDEITVDFEKIKLQGRLLSLGILISNENNPDGLYCYDERCNESEPKTLKEFKINIGSIYIGKSRAVSQTESLSVKFTVINSEKVLLDWGPVKLDYDYACIFTKELYIGHAFSDCYLLSANEIKNGRVVVELYKYGKKISTVGGVFIE